MTKLNVQSIFHSIDGEVNGFYGAGQMATFIRLKGCQLHCQYCDTSYSQNSQPENWMEINDIVEQIQFSKVTLTGGEPLLQFDGVLQLGKQLWFKRVRDYKTQLSIETNGACVPFLNYPPEFLKYIMDYKLASSGMEDKMNLEAFNVLTSEDVIKFVIADWNDYNRALEVLNQNPNWKARPVFSPAMALLQREPDNDSNIMIDWPPKYDMTWPRQLLEKMLVDKLDIQFSLQLHKLIWPEANSATNER